MTTKSPAISSSTDLVLQLADGSSNGRLLAVSTAKCLLSSLITDNAEAEKYRCAIFRGEKGVAFRSYSEFVLVNGNKTSVQWLKEGDTIQLTPDLKVIVKHLGSFSPTKATTPSAPSAPSAPNVPNAPVAAPRETTSNLALGSGVNVGDANTLQQLNASVSTSKVTPPSDPQIGQRVAVLSDQLSSLVDAASQSGIVPTAAGATSSPASEPTAGQPLGQPLGEQKIADASSGIQDYLREALASPSAHTTESTTSTAQTPVVVPNTPVASAAPTAEAHRPEAALELPATYAAATAPPNVPAPRQQEVASSLDRLLGGAKLPSSLDQDLPSVPQPTVSQAVTATETAAPVAVAQPVEATADAPPKAQATEFLKSLGIDAAELGLSDKTPIPANTTPELLEPVIPQESGTTTALPTADEIIASAAAAAAGTAASAGTAALPDSKPAPLKKAESVADVLARMQNAGSLDSFSMDGPEEQASTESSSLPAEVTSPKPEVSETVVAEASSENESAADADGSVENYMHQLLNRMRGGEDSKVDDEAANIAPPKASSSVAQQAPTENETLKTSQAELPPEKLTPEQFVPKEKAVRMKSFDSLREIANNSNRLAIQDHLANQRRVSTQTKMQLAFISLGFGVLFFLMSYVFSSEVSVSGVVCGVAFLICGVVFAKFYRDEQQLDQSIIKAQKDKA